MSISVTYVDSPIGAQLDAVATATTAQPFGNAEQITKGTQDKPWASLEKNSWSLDGSRRLLKDKVQDVGWWSENKTDNNGRFSEPPVITLSFTQPYTATGITFVFWPSLNLWCNDITVTWYNGDEVLTTKNAEPDNVRWVLEETVESFDKIEIKLLGTNLPGQFAKIQQVIIGHTVFFLQDELVKVSLLNEVDPSLCELSTDTMKVEIFAKEGRKLFPQENQIMYLHRDGEQIAAQYITDYSLESGSYYTFNCQSAIGCLEDVFLGGIYNGYYVDTLLKKVLDGISANWKPFEKKTVTGYLPACSRREALQQIAFAIGAVVTTQGDGTIRLVELPKTIEAEFTENDVFTGAKINSHARIATVQIVAHSYKAISDEENLIKDEEIIGENVLFVFDEPHHSYEITGGTIEESGYNWVKITAEGKVTLTGKKYLHSTYVKKKENRYATATEKNNIISVENATLIHSGNVEEALIRLYDFNMLNKELEQGVIVTGQKTGQMTKSVAPIGQTIEGYITSMNNEFTNTGHTADIKIRGKETIDDTIDN